jgi:hypothetical protein
MRGARACSSQPLPLCVSLIPRHVFRYIGFLKKVDPTNCFDEDLDEKLRRFNVGGHDCPVFDAMFQCVSTARPPALRARPPMLASQGPPPYPVFNRHAGTFRSTREGALPRLSS